MARRVASGKRPFSSETLKEEFGITSQLYSVAINKLNALWTNVKDEEEVKQKYNSWWRSMEVVYGEAPSGDLFLRHTYLATLVKLVLYFWFERNSTDRNLIEKEELKNVINGEYFSSKGIANLLENDFSTWILHDKIVADSLDLVYWLARELSGYDFSQIDEDIFKEIYEDLVEKEERHKAGEYYTPEWLAQLILLEVFSIWKKEQSERGKLPRILDPACGSGTFLHNAIHILKNEYGNMVALEDIINNVIGVDVNPLACLIAKANYLIALGDILARRIPAPNIVIPIFLADTLKLPKEMLREVDILVGNPPWNVMRNIKNKEYQEFLKREVLKYNLIDKWSVHLYTQIEVASLFFYKCSDYFLKNGGVIGFVMPRSVISATLQHVNFRRFQRPPLKLVKILDLEDVKPLFNMPACVLIAVKGESTKYPVMAVKYRGELPRKNVKLEEARKLLITEHYAYSPPEFSTTRSYYYDKFKVGASIFPRTLYFIDVISSSDGLLLVRTSREIFEITKPRWKVELVGEVEPDFIYLTLLAWEIVPFGYLRLRPVILPVKLQNGGFKVFDFTELRELGFTGVSGWFEKAQRIWEERRTQRSAKRFPRLVDRLDYNGLLTHQNPHKRYVVLYNATGSNIVSCVVDRKSLPNLGHFSNGFIADVKTWFYETDNEYEAYYLSAVFNSDLINKLIKPFQPKGLFGTRAVHRRPLLFPIPKFEENNEIHLKLAEVGRICHEKVKNILLNKGLNKKRIGEVRKHIRESLSNEMKYINVLVSKLLEEQMMKPKRVLDHWVR